MSESRLWDLQNSKTSWRCVSTNTTLAWSCSVWRTIQAIYGAIWQGRPFDLTWLVLYYSLLSSHQTISYCSSMILIEIDILYTNTQYYTKYLQVSTTEEHRPSMKLRDLQKGHGCPFSPTAQTAKNVGTVIQCEECGKRGAFMLVRSWTRRWGMS